ncbi:MAG: hybrid sensor histidine kinase/response regulator [Crocinitomicaceae bacterium]|nr:hybrid sensor histidine kinase/response regulator [Crocinitomicaceae bacterium]
MSEERPRVVYLDDEENNLMAFKAMFRREFEIFTTTSAADAVAYLNQHEVQLILSDQKMPDISGVEFFELTYPDFPDAVRILVTGYADMEAVIDAINKGHVYRYVTKPWNENDFRVTMLNGVEKWRNAKELRSKNEKLERAVDELEKFVYSASHDLRAPVVSIMGVTNLAKSENLGEKASEYFSMIEQSTGRLDSFLQNLIHYYQNLKSDEIKTEIDFNLLLDQLIEKYRPLENASSVNVTKDISTAGKFVTDEHRLSMVLGNLISNALRFRDSAKDQNNVEIHVVQTSDRAVIRIIDNGVGIDKDKLPHIFDMFYGTSELSKGTGVGLYIAKEATRRLNGKLSVTSDLESGTRFTIEIPNRA